MIDDIDIEILNIIQNNGKNPQRELARVSAWRLQEFSSG